jgi:hypothetical protein
MSQARYTETLGLSYTLHLIPTFRWKSYRNSCPNLHIGTTKAAIKSPVEAKDMRFGPFLGLAILLFVLWAGGFLFFHVAGALIHLLLLFALISIVVHFFTAARTA